MYGCGFLPLEKGALFEGLGLVCSQRPWTRILWTPVAPDMLILGLRGEMLSWPVPCVSDLNP